MEERFPLIRNFILFFLSLEIFYLVWIAFTLEVHYNDTYAILINARELVVGRTDAFSVLRPLFLPLFYLVFFFLPSNFPTEIIVLLIGKVFAIGSFIAFLWIAYKIFSRSLEGWIALIALFLLSTNRVLIHLAPFIKEDIIGALFLAIAFCLYLKYEEHKTSKYLRWISLWFSLAILTRYNLAPFIILFVISYELFSQQWKIDFWKKLIFFILIPIVVFVLAMSFVGVVLSSAEDKNPVGAIQSIFSLIQSPESPKENFEYLLKACSLPIVVFFLYGVFMAVKEKTKGWLFFVLWFLIFFLLQTLLIGHKEARYLIPALIPVYFFSVYGLRKILSSAKGRILSCVIVIAILAVPFKNAFYECWHFQDAVYKTDFQKKVSKKAIDLAAGHNILWAGPMYTQYPKNYVFHLDDEFFYMFHFFANTVSYFAKAPVNYFIQPRMFHWDDFNQGIYVRGIGKTINNGDVLIVNMNENAFVTRTIKDTVKPLIVQKARIEKFLPKGQSLDFVSLSNPNMTIEIKENKIKAKGLDFKSCEVYFDFEDVKENLTFQPIKIINGSFLSDLPGGNWHKVKQIRLLYYKDIQIFRD